MKGNEYMVMITETDQKVEVGLNHPLTGIFVIIRAKEYIINTTEKSPKAEVSHPKYKILVIKKVNNTLSGLQGQFKR